MNKLLGITLALALGAMAILGWLYQSQRSELAVSKANEAVLVSANQGHVATLKALQEVSAAEDAIIEKKLSQDENLAKAVRRLESKLQGALNNAKNQSFTFDSVLPADAITALCVQWHKASGYNSGSGANATTGAAHARAPHTTTTGGISKPDCSGWQGLTLRAAIEWAGLLLTHAGHERLDKGALREWAEKAKIKD